MWDDRDGTVWVADQNEGRLMRFATGTYTVLEPLVLCPGRDPILDVATNGRGRVYATCYSSDSVRSFLRNSPESTAVSLTAGDGPGALMVVQR